MIVGCNADSVYFEAVAISIARSRLPLLLAISIVLTASVIFASLCLLVAARVGHAAPWANQAILTNDFIAHYAGARLAARGHAERVYDREEMHALEKEIAGSADAPLLRGLYPPFFYLMMMPLAFLDMTGAYRLFAATTLVAALLAAYRIAPHWHTLVLGAVFPAVAFSFATGQNGNLSAALVGTGLLLLPFKPVAAGVSFGLLAAYKPQLALAIPFCLIGGGYYRTLTALVATVAATILLSLVAFGSSTLLGFLSSIPEITQGHFGEVARQLGQRMPTVLVAVLQVTKDETLARTLQGLALAGALTGLIYVWRKSTQPTLRAISLVATMPLATPYFFDYDLAIFVIPLAFLMRKVRVSGLAWKHLFLLTVLWVLPPAITFLPGAMYWPIAPIAWTCLLAFAVFATNRAGPLRGLSP